MPQTRKLIKVKTGRRKCKQRVWRRKWKLVGTPGPAVPAAAGTGPAVSGSPGQSGSQPAPGAAPAATPAAAPGTTRGPRPRIKTDKTEKTT